MEKSRILRITREMLENAKVIGQFDRKFIVCRMPSSKEDPDGDALIVAFDQHAVHERIRLERLYKDHGIDSTVAISDTFKATLAQTACKSAIRFGDKLSREKCKKLIKSLCKCARPFQCAHGRPSVVPLIRLPEKRDETSG